MDNLLEQVKRARGKMTRDLLLSQVGWWLFGALVVAALAIAAPKVFAIPGLPQRWAEMWLSGAAAVGLFGAGITTYLCRSGAMDAAVEIDRRFGLRERVASSLSLPEAEHESEVGLALINDAARSVERIDVSDEFPVRVGRPAWLPLVPAVVAFALMTLVGDREPAAATTRPPAAANAQQVKKSTEALRKKIEKKIKEAEDKEKLKDATNLLREVKRGVEEVERKKDAGRKQTAVKLNDLAKQLEDRKKQLGGSKAIENELKKLKNFGKGPAEKAAEAMKQGNFDKALKEIERMMKQLAEGKMPSEEQQKLGEQLGKMKEQLEKAVNAQKQAAEDLQKQIEQQQRKGNNKEAQKLQQKLDQMQQQQQQMDKLQELANKMGQAQKAMENGDQQAAADAMQQMSDQLDQMQQEIDEMEMLSDAQDQIEMAKQAMGCQDCQGGGQGQQAGGGQRQGKGEGQGMGKGQGAGPRPDEKNDTRMRDSRVRQNPGAGSSTFGGLVKGPQKKGDVRETLKEALAPSEVAEAEAVDDERLPRARREHVEEYFKKLRDKL
ncbi:MAG: hypothetical protein AAGB00_11800 [Planctomycetota bacterium]